MSEPRGVGEPDGLERLWTPHRMAYVKSAQADVDDGGDEGDAVAAADAPCPFCRIPTLPDEEGLVVARGEAVYAVLNLYPYNAGHLMVVPFRHVADYADASDAEIDELAEYTRHALRAIRSVSAPQGFNVGINLGAAAGAGIASHLHQHVVPRWNGDANFITVVGRTKVLPQLLAETWRLLTAAW